MSDKQPQNHLYQVVGMKMTPCRLTGQDEGRIMISCQPATILHPITKSTACKSDAIQ